MCQRPCFLGWWSVILLGNEQSILSFVPLWPMLLPILCTVHVNISDWILICSCLLLQFPRPIHISVGCCTARLSIGHMFGEWPEHYAHQVVLWVNSMISERELFGYCWFTKMIETRRFLLLIQWLRYWVWSGCYGLKVNIGFCGCLLKMATFAASQGINANCFSQDQSSLSLDFEWRLQQFVSVPSIANFLHYLTAPAPNSTHPNGCAHKLCIISKWMEH